MEEFLKFVITPLLSNPEGLKIEVQPNNINLKVADEDVGRIIGKQGNVINAIRTLLKTWCATHQSQPINLTLLTPPKAA